MNVYYFNSCMVPYSSLVLQFSVPFHSVPGVSLPRETFHTHTFSPSLSHLECWCGLFYSVLHSELQLNCYFITTFNKNQQVHETARKEWSCLPAWLPALVCCPSVCVLCAPCAPPLDALVANGQGRQQEQALEQMERDFVAPSSLY